jgi:quercetin dioxygenase-like cupin family protein
VEQWQLPIVLKGGSVLCFMSHLKPGAIVPTHAHKHPVFRVVIAGELIFGRKRLKVGDWMYVPPKQAYSIKAGPNGLCHWYGHP